jgi:DedD protein
MEKEMKKLLLVAVSVGVFLLVTITVAIIILTPKMQQDTVSSSVPYSNQETYASITKNPPPEPAPVIISTAEPIIETDMNNGDSLTIKIPQPTTAAVPDSPTVAAPPVLKEPAVVVVKPAEKQAVSTSAPAVKPAVSVKPSATAKPSASNTAAKPASTRAINDYWVQTGAFSSMVRAEDAKEMLFDKGLTSIIETSIINGQNFFRVRLGPYTSENEAKHWLAIVKLIDGFHDSQVRQTVR